MLTAIEEDMNREENSSEGLLFRRRKGRKLIISIVSNHV